MFSFVKNIYIYVYIYIYIYIWEIEDAVTML